MENNNLNKKMIEGQIKPLGNINDNILEAFSSIPRDNFVPKELQDLSYLEKHLDLKNNRFLLKASLIAKIISLADIKSNDTVLIIGSSTGYSSAILSRIAETVISIEEEENLISFSENAVQEKEIDNVVFINKKLSDGCPEHGPFSKIIIEGAIEIIPEKIIEQLDNNGKMIVIYAKKDLCEAREYTKVKDKIGHKFLFNCEAPRLNSFDKSDSFNF